MESGEIIRFAWRVLDAELAKPVNREKGLGTVPDRSASRRSTWWYRPIEQIGQLRQSVAPESGKSYWMAFSNKGRLVKRGDRVNVVIGPFRADGLVVD